MSTRQLNAEVTSNKIERWGTFELSLKGPVGANPFLDVKLIAQFKHENQIFDVEGFYDGDGIYRVRFMPEQQGIWTYRTKSNRSKLDGHTGKFTCVEPSTGNHGPVGVRNTYHFGYADGTPFFPVGTTLYGWTQQSVQLEEQTLAVLKSGPFNKVRMSATPHEPSGPSVYYPFKGSPPKNWDFTHLNPKYFQHLEKRIGELRNLGIETDLILFHSHACCGFSEMDGASDDLLVSYLIARLSAYRNVWWSLSNEFDLIKKKSISDWDRIFKLIRDKDPYGHLRSIHNCHVYYDHCKSWVTHLSIQHQSSDFTKPINERDRCRKPLIIDECGYEGDMSLRWGSLSAKEMIHRFWLATVAGSYVTHGETYKQQFFRKGGQLHGESLVRIAFLKRIIEDGLIDGLEPINRWTAGKDGEYYLSYFGVHQPGRVDYDLPKGKKFKIDIIDTWKMTITSVRETFEGKFQLNLPGRSRMAVRIRRVQ